MRPLGRGLQHLIADQFESLPREAPIDAIEPNPRQPRSVFDETALEELAESIREHGILQPLVVRPKSEDRYELIAGERRLRAAKKAGLRHVPIIIRSAGAQDSLELALIENIQREDIGALEKARAYRRLMDEFGLTQEEVSHKVGKARSSVANTVRLLKLPAVILEALEQGKITEGHAKTIVGLNTRAEQLALFDKIVKQNLNVRDVEKAKAAPAQPKQLPKGDDDPNWVELQRALSTYLGSPSRLERKAKGEGGRIVVDFYSDEDLERILESLGFAW
jgi:ParB family transcriptional regulator, chromosome partitioning protein